MPHNAAPSKTHASRAPPCTLVLFGARGDLTKRLVVPALYNLAVNGLLPDNFALVGIDHGDQTTEGWIESLHAMLQSFVGNPHSEMRLDRIDDEVWARLTMSMSYVRGDFTDPTLYRDLAGHLEASSKKYGTRDNVMFYLAVADRFFGTIVDELAASGLTNESTLAETCWRRVVVEKPFGNDVATARALNTQILATLREDQIFRIDHFMGKDPVQNIMTLRSFNAIFKACWNRDHIDHVQITVSEVVGVEKRGKFYEQTGALRDMVPNHVFSLLALVAMEPPTTLHGSEIMANKAHVFTSMRAAEPRNAVRGQYGDGTVAGAKVTTYRSEANVAPNSNVETYVAMRLDIDTPRWSGVPFYIRTGKHTAQRLTEIAVCFKSASLASSASASTPACQSQPNWLVFQIAPDEGLSLHLEVRRPGPVTDLAPVSMTFNYDDWFTRESSVGYETLLYDVMNGDTSLFMSADIVEASWRVVQPLLDAWIEPAPDFPNYASGSDGPEAADELLLRDGRAWRSWAHKLPE